MQVHVDLRPLVYLVASFLKISTGRIHPNFQPQQKIILRKLKNYQTIMLRKSIYLWVATCVLTCAHGQTRPSVGTEKCNVPLTAKAMLDGKFGITGRVNFQLVPGAQLVVVDVNLAGLKKPAGFGDYTYHGPYFASTPLEISASKAFIKRSICRYSLPSESRVHREAELLVLHSPYTSGRRRWQLRRNSGTS
jgi:hypothetical protein